MHSVVRGTGTPKDSVTGREFFFQFSPQNTNYIFSKKKIKRKKFDRRVTCAIIERVESLEVLKTSEQRKSENT